MTYWVYILASRKHGTLTIGMTNNLARRIHEHREGRGSSQREKTIKEWPRAWKIRQIMRGNPEWRDLSKKVCRVSHLGSRLRGNDEGEWLSSSGLLLLSSSGLLLLSSSGLTGGTSIR
jgi:putative endonuclease